MKTGIQGGLGENGRLSKRARDGSASIISGVALWSFLAVEYSTLVTAVTIHRGSVILMTGRRIMRRMSSVAYVDMKKRWVSVTIKSQQWWIMQTSSWKDEDMNIFNRAYHLECTAHSVSYSTWRYFCSCRNCFLSVSLSFVKFRSVREVSIAAAAANKCQRISVSYANILPGWKRTHFTAINVVFVGKLLQIGVPIITYNQF